MPIIVTRIDDDHKRISKHHTQRHVDVHRAYTEAEAAIDTWLETIKKHVGKRKGSAVEESAGAAKGKLYAQFIRLFDDLDVGDPVGDPYEEFIIDD